MLRVRRKIWQRSMVCLLSIRMAVNRATITIKCASSHVKTLIAGVEVHFLGSVFFEHVQGKGRVDLARPSNKHTGLSSLDWLVSLFIGIFYMQCLIFSYNHSPKCSSSICSLNARLHPIIMASIAAII